MIRSLLPSLALCGVVAVAGAQPASAPTWAPALDSITRVALARTGTPGVQIAVVQEGRLVYERAFGVADIESGRPATTRTLFRIGSLTKMITAATVLELVAAGQLDLQAPIGRYVPEIAARGVGRVTTHQLLTHTAGWRDQATPWGRMGEGALGEVFREVTDTLFIAAPGERFAYSNPGYSMVGYVVERAGGARFAAQVERRVLRPAGMLRSTFRPLEVMTTDFSQGHAGAAAMAPTVVRPFTENTAQWAAGFLLSTAGELARFAQLLMDGGSIDGQRVLAPTTVPQLTTGQVALPQDSSARYGYGLIIGTRDGVRRWRHAGGIPGFLSTITLWPDQRAAVIVLGNRDATPLPEIERFVATQVMRGGR